ncbi:MAG: hypothetical protein J6G98_02915 [Bacilli bacterium]|nr:hypothetical protein [Bacilli bacterium]
MFEQLREYLKNEYNNEMNLFDSLKAQMEELENNLKVDDSEDVYKSSIKALKKKFGIFKRNSKEYKNELYNIQSEYYNKLKDFEAKHDHYLNLKKEASQINIYVIQKKLERLNNANSLEDLKLTEEDATKIMSGERTF